jgi:hypothetical protein
VEYFVFTPEGRKVFTDHVEAIAFATETGKKIVMDYMIAAGYCSNDVGIEVTRKDMVITEGEMPMESKIIVVGVGTSHILMEKSCIPEYMRKKAFSFSKALDGSYSGK